MADVRIDVRVVLEGETRDELYGKIAVLEALFRDLGSDIGLDFKFEVGEVEE